MGRFKDDLGMIASPSLDIQILPMRNHSDEADVGMGRFKDDLGMK